MDKRVEFHVESDSKNSIGETETTFSKDFTTWANVKESGGEEKESSGQISATWDVTFTIRYRSTVTREYRVKYDGEFYDIVEMKTLGRDEFLEVKGKRIWQT